MKWVFQAIRDRLWTLGINCGHLTSIKGGFTQHLMLIWVIKQNFCDWAVGSLEGKVTAKVCGSRAVPFTPPWASVVLRSRTVFSLFLRGFNFLVVSSWGLLAWDRYVHPVSGNSVCTWWESSEKFLWSWAVRLFSLLSFSNKRCQIKSFPCSEGMGWH